MRCSYSTLVKAKRAGRATSVRVAPTGTAVEQYQVPLGNRHSLKEAGVIGLPSWSEKATQTETWVKVPRLSTTCPRRVVAFDGGRGNIDKTMEFGDDFDGTTLDTAKWAVVTGTPTVSEGVLTLPAGANISSIPGFGSDTVTRFRAAMPIPDYNSMGYGVAANTPNFTYGAAHASVIDANNGGAIQSLASPSSVATTYFIKRGGGANKWGRNLTVDVTSTLRYATTVSKLWFGGGDRTLSGKIEWIIIGKYITSEPLAGTAQPSTTNRALSRALSRANLIRSCCT